MDMSNDVSNAVGSGFQFSGGSPPQSQQRQKSALRRFTGCAGSPLAVTPSVDVPLTHSAPTREEIEKIEQEILDAGEARPGFKAGAPKRKKPVQGVEESGVAQEANESGDPNADSAVDSTGVNAQFVEKDIAPFASGGYKIFPTVDNSNLEKKSSKSELDGPDTSDLGPEKGRLDRLHEQYKGDPSDLNLKMLLVEVERYARHVASLEGGKLKRWLNQSPTYQYPMTDTSTTTMIKVWRHLDTFNGQSKFSSWVYSIARNNVKDIVKGVIKRGERDLLGGKDYQGSYHGSRAAAAKSEDGSYETGGGAKTRLGPPPPSIPSPPVSSLQPKDRGVDDATLLRLSEVAAALSGRDEKILRLFLDGYTPIEIGKKMGGRNPKWASNQLDRIKKALRLANGDQPTVLDVKKEENAKGGAANSERQ
jgi:RNA polymerase sigma factor (sigma-70 family)